MSLYREHRFWSPVLGCDAARLSMVGGTAAARFHGAAAATQEFYAVIRADVNGRVYRERRNTALDQIEDAIERGTVPGEVTVDLTIDDRRVA